MAREQTHYWMVEDCAVVTATETFGRLAQADVAGAEVDPWAQYGVGGVGGVRVRYVPVPCPLGGGRFLFVCPGCGRRAFKLYAPPPFDVYACRTCQDLTYESRRRRAGLVATLCRSIRLTEELASRAHSRGRKPKRFYRLLAEAQAVQAAVRRAWPPERIP